MLIIAQNIIAGMVFPDMKGGFIVKCLKLEIYLSEHDATVLELKSTVLKTLTLPNLYDVIHGLGFSWVFFFILFYFLASQMAL